MDTKKGFTNDVAIVAIGLIAIVSIAVWVINANAEYYKQAAKAAEATNVMLIGQRDIVIKKLLKQADARSTELASARQASEAAKAELNASKKKIDSIKAIVQ